MRILLALVFALGMAGGLAACKTVIQDPSESWNRLDFLERNGV